MPSSAPTFTVVIEPAGWTFTAPADVPILQAAREAGFVLPSSCRNGTCRACLCPVKSGQTAYTIEWPGVSADEKTEGLILPCVSVARSDLVIEAPRAILVSQLARRSPFAKTQE
ncbi:2Fe-2S iron-sulfur cluster-binding protein [Pararobbsia alpina]|uniref:Ferredoxin n=1 Tax=Pararobbsia alpina TaxID=621374 RepID=A0A6S7B2P0_9BURK|nr:2Fe-2S iron-sulfur cluster-binding protein [Pararobbsia alpina]CAB3785167.1 Ferredoxin [Pararobbsia alpina]